MANRLAYYLGEINMIPPPFVREMAGRREYISNNYV